MKIVHIGKGTAPNEINHIIGLRDAGHDVYVPGDSTYIIGLRDAGHDVYVPGDSTYEQLVRRIIDADEIHVWDADMVFELGMVYFYSVHALHYRLSWIIKVFCDPGPALLPIFTQQSAEPCKGESARQPYDEVPTRATTFVPPCSSGLGPCKECGDEDRCNKLRAEHNDS